MEKDEVVCRECKHMVYRCGNFWCDLRVAENKTLVAVDPEDEPCDFFCGLRGNRDVEKVRVMAAVDFGAKMPTYAHASDAGMDLYSDTKALILPHSRATISTGVHICIPDGYYGAIRAKSGLLHDYGLLCSGTVDAGYTGEIKVTLVNTSGTEVPITKGQKIAQMIICPYVQAVLEPVKEFPRTERGSDGFGSTGIK